MLQYADLYCYQAVVEYLKQEGYNYVSYRKKTTPSTGSPCYQISALKPDAEIAIKKVVQHVDGSVTLKTSEGNLRFWKL